MERVDKLLQYLSLLNDALKTDNYTAMDRYYNEQRVKVCKEIDKVLYVE